MGNPKIAIEPDSGALWIAPHARADERAELALQFIPAGARVLDLGRGGAALKKLLPHGCAYQGCATAVDEPDTLICDLAAGEFPAAAAAGTDIILMLGLLERVADADALFAQLQAAGRTVVLSCGPSDLAPEGASRRANDRVGFFDLARLFDRHGFRIECTAPFGNGQMMVRLVPFDRLAPLPTWRVAVVSGGDDFAERLGRHMIGTVLPGESLIEHMTFDAIAPAAPRYDLVVVGVGGGLAPPLPDQALFDLLGRAAAAIGIFGTQYRELMPRATLDRLLDRLDVWYARHESDMLMYGRGRDNAVHLGDWLIEQFALTEASLDEPLLIGGGAGQGADLATTIGHIQRCRRVYSTQAAALLCALTSAETVAYAEPPNSRLPGVACGDIRGMLIDIFGRSYPEKDFFLVDRDAVMRYKARVRDNVAAMRRRIATLLRVEAATTA